MGERIAILSGKGGTGKTSVCAGLSQALAEQKATVLCIDCDIGLRNLDISLGLSDAGALSFLDVCSGGYALEQAAVHPAFPTLHFLTAPVLTSAEEVDGEAFAQLLLQARNTYDYVFLDAPAGVDSAFRLVARNADRVILVTGADPAAMRDGARCADLLAAMGKTDLRLVVNRVDRRMFSNMAVTVDDVMDTTGVPLLGIVPEDPNVTLSAVFGECLLSACPRSGASRAFRRIARRLQGRPTPIPLR